MSLRENALMTVNRSNTEKQFLIFNYYYLAKNVNIQIPRSAPSRQIYELSPLIKLQIGLL